VNQTKKKNKAYLRRVGELGCVICHGEAVAHHKTGAGMGIKASDYDTFPLCLIHHTGGGKGVAIHEGVKTWEAKHGTQDYWIKWTQQQLGE